ncbi:MAG: alginate lyase family protein, partial [Verrucomicrobia bacterium]|nr:alginate lyase family protein [Verrucomicrobiota bacterium]
NAQSKQQDDPDPALTYTLTAGTLIDGIPLTGELTREPGETAGIYAIQQGTLTAANNPAYAIIFVPANLEIIAPVIIPPPVVVPSSGIWISAEEIADLPMTGDPWRLLKADADTYWGVPNLSDQEDKANIYTMSKAIVYARTGIESYRTDVIEACMQAIGTEAGGRTLALGRNLAAFVIAADLIGLPPEEDAIFRAWLEEVTNEPMTEGINLIWTHENRPNNWGTHAGASRAAVAVYLNDRDELDRIAQVFKGYLGDRNSYAGFKYGDLYWQADPAHPVGINPKGATIQGHNVDGVLPDDQRRAAAGEFTWPPPKENYVYEGLQGALLQAVILSRAGYDVWNWEDKALLRAFTWLHDVADFPAEGDDLWQPFIVNHYYGTDFPTPATSRSGKNVARTCWTHQ